MRNKNIVTKNVIYGITGLTLLILAISLGTQTPSSAQSSSIMDEQNSTIASRENSTIYHGEDYVKLLAQSMENRLEKDAAVLEITSMLPEVKDVSYAHMLNNTIEQLKGIPQNADILKRQIAKDILQKFGDFQVVFFIMPNGDIYFIEPYTQQENLSKTNFAFRDYYKGAITNNDTFLGNVIVSAASGQSQAVMAVPIHSGANGSLTGIWAGGLDMSQFNESLQLLNLSNNERVVYVDNLGQVVADSDKQSLSQNESFANLQGFKNAINGKSGTIKETVNGTETLVSYYPVKAPSNKWAVLLIQPNNVNPAASSSSNYAIANNSIIENNKQKEMPLQNTSK